MTQSLVRPMRESFESAHKYGYDQAFFPLYKEVAIGTCASNQRNILLIQIVGNAIGGLSVGEPAEEMYAMTEVVCEILPEDKPRYVGTA
jgi:queuine tRNA-ribosyltransferase